MVLANCQSNTRTSPDWYTGEILRDMIRKEELFRDSWDQSAQARLSESLPFASLPVERALIRAPPGTASNERTLDDLCREHKKLKCRNQELQTQVQRASTVNGKRPLASRRTASRVLSRARSTVPSARSQTWNCRRSVLAGEHRHHVPAGYFRVVEISSEELANVRWPAHFRDCEPHHRMAGDYRMDGGGGFLAGAHKVDAINELDHCTIYMKGLRQSLRTPGVAVPATPQWPARRIISGTSLVPVHTHKCDSVSSTNCAWCIPDQGHLLLGPRRHNLRVHAQAPERFLCHFLHSNLKYGAGHKQL